MITKLGAAAAAPPVFDDRFCPRSLAASLVLILASVLTACTSAPRQENEIIERHVRYLCDNKEGVELRFFPQQGVAVLVRHGRTIELQQQRAASGFVYSNSPTTVRGKGDEITLEIGRMVPLKCKAV